MSWEFLPKHIFVLSAAGKPIFTRHGDEQDMVTVFGLLQAVYSIAQDAGDRIRCIMAGKRRIIYFVKESLYFVCVSSTGEPEAVLIKQLEFLYCQVLLVLTSKVHDVLRSNASKDLRDLLGSDTTRLMHASCRHDVTAPSIAFNAIRGTVLPRELRAELLHYLKGCVANSGAAVGLLLHDESLLAYCLHADQSLVLDVADVLLLTHFVGNSTSLKSHDHNWVPLCLPAFNARAFLQAYIAGYKLHGAGVVQRPVEVTLVLIATSAAPEMFKDLHMASEAFQKFICQREVVQRIGRSIEDRQKYLAKYQTSTLGLHFFYQYRPLIANYAAGGGGGTEGGEEEGRNGHGPLLPPQCVWSSFEFPLTTQDAQNKIWALYQRVACCLRGGTATPEFTLLKQKQSATRREDASAAGDGGLRESQAALGCAVSEGGDGTHPQNIMGLQPSSDHSLAYLVLEEGQIVVGLANLDSELLATFPATLGVLEACNQASILSRTLRNDALLDLFQIEL